MKAPVCSRSAYALLRLGLLGLIFIVVTHSPAKAQSCTGNCVAVVYAGDNGARACFTTTFVEGACPAPPFTQISFGQTVDFYEPAAALIDAHTATAGSCPGGICSPSNNFRIPNTATECSTASHYMCNQDYYITFDGTVRPGGLHPLNAGTYAYYCEPHGSMMVGTIQVLADTTSVSLSSGSPSPSVVFQAVNSFTVTVSNTTAGVGIIPSGQARLLVDGVPVTGFIALSSGSFTFNGIIFNSSGLHSVTAQFQDPNGNFASNTSNTVFQQVNPDSTSVSLSSGNPNPSVINQPVNNFAVTVSNTSGTGVTPSGQAQLLIDGLPATAFVAVLGSVTFNNIAFSSGGAHNVTAQFQDLSGSFASNTSNTVVQQVRDFSINITNPSGSAVPTANYDFAGTLTAIDGYSAAVNITCTNGSTTPPNTCALLSPSNPVPMGSAFTVRASNSIAANTFSFNIQAASNSGFSDIRSFPVTLNVGSFSLGALSPSSVSVAQGNASGALAFQVSALGGFSGNVTLSCPSNPAGVTCIFANGSSTQNLFLEPLQTMNDTLVLNTSSALPVNNYLIAVQAVSGASPAQQQTFTLHEVAGGPASVTVVYFGPPGNQNWPNGPIFAPLNVVPVGQSYSFMVTAVNYNNYNLSGLTNASTGVQMVIRFSEPVASASASVTAPINNGGTDSCGPLINSVEIQCNLNNIPYVPQWWSGVTVTVNRLASTSVLPRSEDVTVEVTSTNANLGYPSCPPAYANAACNSITGGTPLRIRPMIRPALKSGSPNPR